ncbi:MAG: carboxypeptidase regulatory-like domain-containing protein [Oscillospiraceae bacterium]
MPIIDKYNLKASVQFPITGTEEVTENLQLTVSPAAAAGIVTGIVTSGGVPIEGATVKIFDVNDNPIAHDLTNPQGRYTIPEVAAGSYKITATKFTYLTPDAIPFSVVANRPTTVDIELTLDPDVDKNALYGFIKQAVVFTPIEGATVNIYQVVAGVQTLALTTVTNSSGQYFGPRLVSGDFVVVANKLGYEQAQSSIITLTGTDIEPLDLFLQVNTQANVGTVSGIITDQATLLPIANALVALYSVVGATETIVQIARSNTGGRYLFGNVAEGDYIVKAIAQTDVAP